MITQKEFSRWNMILGWGVFIIASVVYMLTLEPTTSWWDCGEYISTAYKLQVGHPPGAPTFQLLGRFFSLFAMGDVEKVALMINAMSAFSSSLTILFLFWTIVFLARKLVGKVSEFTPYQAVAVFGSALVGSMAFTFSDSFWFSAAEGEVYALSSLFTAITFWAILKWETVADQEHSLRWIILISFLIGLSIGIHLLNLLAIPAITFVYYFKKFEPTRKGVILVGTLSIIILAVIMYVIIPGIVWLSGMFELFFINSIGLPFNSGTIIYFVLLIGALVWGLMMTERRGRVVLNTFLLGLVFILIGYSSFFMLIIRSNADVPIDENSPEDAISLLSYLNREQYGSTPLFYGPYYNAPVVDYDDGTPIYVKDVDKGKYVITDDRKGVIPVYDSRFETLFPRMWSNQKSGHVRYYKEYGKVKGRSISVTRNDGSTEVLQKPTFTENLRFFFRYQVGHMYLRYFMWNFSGRQNDIESQGEPDHGNWISGIGFIDNARLGDQSNLPVSMENAAKNKFYMLPLLLGLVGFYYQLNRSKKDTWIVFLLFLMTGLAIVVYLNQYPLQPRERDYAYTGSFYAFSIWIGLGVMGAIYFVNKYLRNASVAVPVAVTLALLILVPGIMAKEGWDDHDRSGKYAARDFAKNYLRGCDTNAILVTFGDNDTFPLWYVQEVEEFRTDVRVVNHMLASGYWYVHQMFKKVYDSDPLPFTLSYEQYENGVNNYIPIFEHPSLENKYTELSELIKFVANEDDRTKLSVGGGTRNINYFPTRKVRLTVDSAKCVDNGIVPSELADQIVPFIEWEIKQSALYKNDLMVLDFLATSNWERAFYLANPSSLNEILGIDRYIHQEGMVYKFMPVRTTNFISGIGGVNADKSYEVLTECTWGNLNDPDVTVDRESYRNSRLPRQNFLRAAESLMRKGEAEKAVALLDTSLYYFPDSKITYDVLMIPYAELYYSAGEIEKGNEVAHRLLDIFGDDVRYYTSLDNEFATTYYQQDYQRRMSYINGILEMVTENEQEELIKRAEEILELYSSP
jgi:hypothetical protein